ncbi:MAG TPA: hypothetical protein VKF17_16655 [Isosphaeraceae bacterium]|nr:hypothetical protein [Isosphaeraceae bacterium]
MRVWSKTTDSGKTLELRFEDRSISVYLDEVSKGCTGTITELDERQRRPGMTYAQAPRTNARGEKITHAVYIAMLTGQEAKEVIRIFEAEKTEYSGRLRAESLAAVATQYEEAKRTGKPVSVQSWTDTCNDRECNCCGLWDRWVNPNGTFKITCRHTY